MLIACHLFSGLIAGLFLQDRFHSPRAVPVCLLGSVLPDLIDKPLGFIIFPATGDGRLIAHALAGLIIIGIMAAVLLRDPINAIALVTGVALHQVLDAMWDLPVNWFYPLLGPFPVFIQEDYFQWGLIRELTTPSEWAFAAVILILFWQYRGQPGGIRLFPALLSGVPAILLLIAGR